MLSFMIFCHVWSLQVSLVNCDDNTTGPASKTLGSVDGLSTPAVLRVSVPEDHHLCLRCSTPDVSGVAWTRENQEIRAMLTTEGGRRRYRVLPDGALCLLRLDESDGGQYRCNGRVEAELQVLTGHDFVVSAGRTLLLPCGPPYRARQRWFLRRPGGKRELIFTRFRNGTVKPERDGGRLRYGSDALQIQNLRPEDAGEYQCGELQVSVTVMSASPEPSSIHPPTSTTASAVAMETDVSEIQKKDKKRLENALILVAAAGLGTMILLVAAACVLLTNVSCRRRNKGRFTAQRRDDTELQPWATACRQTEYEVFESPSPPEETIHYACLGQQNREDRPSRTPPDQDHQGVVYSSVLTDLVSDRR